MVPGIIGGALVIVVAAWIFFRWASDRREGSVGSGLTSDDFRLSSRVRQTDSSQAGGRLAQQNPEL